MDKFLTFLPKQFLDFRKNQSTPKINMYAMKITKSTQPCLYFEYYASKVRNRPRT